MERIRNYQDFYKHMTSFFAETNKSVVFLSDGVRGKMVSRTCKCEKEKILPRNIVGIHLIENPAQNSCLRIELEYDPIADDDMISEDYELWEVDTLAAVLTAAKEEVEL